MNALLDILGTVGNVLDTPGSIARGLMAGDPGRAFGGIMDPSQRVSGSEMLGMDPHADLFSGEGMAGLGAEMLADPLNLLGGMGLLKLGKARNLAKASNARRAELLASGGMPEEVAKLTKAVDEAGNPLRTYHGTGAVFDQYDIARADPNALYGRGVYTTADPLIASEYAANRYGQMDWIPGTQKQAHNEILRMMPEDTPARFQLRNAVSGNPDDFLTLAREANLPEEAFANLMRPVPQNVRMQHLDLRNPLNLDAAVGRTAFAQGLDESSRFMPALERTLFLDESSRFMPTSDWLSMQSKQGAGPIDELVRAAGYDSMKHKGGLVTGGPRHDVYVALDPSQIYSPWVAPAAQRVPSTSPLLAALGGHNVLRGAGHVMRGNREGLF